MTPIHQLEETKTRLLNDFYMTFLGTFNGEVAVTDHYSGQSMLDWLSTALNTVEREWKEKMYSQKDVDSWIEKGRAEERTRVKEAIDRGLHIDGINIKAFDILDTVPRAVLQNALSMILSLQPEEKL